MSHAFNILSKGIKEEKSFTIQTETGRIIRQGATALKLSGVCLKKISVLLLFVYPFLVFWYLNSTFKHERVIFNGGLCDAVTFA